MSAISGIEQALWDIKGKYYQAPTGVWTFFDMKPDSPSPGALRHPLPMGEGVDQMKKSTKVQVDTDVSFNRSGIDMCNEPPF